MNTHPLPTARYAGAFLIELDPTRDWSGVPGVVHGSDGSAWIDYARTPVAGGTENRIIGYEIADHADQPVRTLRATLQMSTTHDGVHWSLSSGAVNSPLNNLSGSFAPAIFGKRRIIVQDPLGSPASTNPADWRPRFWGHIDDHPSSSSGDLRIFARDAAARLMVPYTGEPVQIGPEGGAVSLHDAAQAVLDAAMGEGEWALLTEDNLNWAFPSFVWEGEEGSVLEALTAMAQQRGAVVRWWPDPVTGRFQLQLFVLQVDKQTPDFTFGPGETFDIPGHGSDTTSYRNDFTLRYVDASGDVQTIRRPATQAEKDAFGFEPLLIGEGSTSHIRTAGEANVMLDAVEAALRVPATVGSRLLPRTPGIEVNSKIRLLPDARVAQEVSDLYVAGWSETRRADESSTVVELRGAPVGRIAAYLESFARPPAPAPSFAIQYAEDEHGTGASDVFDPARHLYARTSDDGGATWTDWFRFVGPPGTSFTIIGSLPDPSDLPPSGNVGDGYLIDGDLWVWDGSAWVNAGRVQGPPGPQGPEGPQGPTGQTGAPGADGQPAIMALLSNDSATIPTAEDGSGGVYTHATTTISVFEGNADRSGLWSYSAAPSAGVTGSLSGRTYSVTAMSTDAGYVDITATRSGYPSLTVRFALAKAKGGAKGDPSTAYWLITDAAAVKRSLAGTYTPAALVVSGRRATGDSAPVAYAGRFQIATLSGSTWTVRYTSGSNQSSYSYPIPANIDAIRVRLYAAGGTTLLLDEEVVPVVEDGEDATAYRMIVDVAAVKRDEGGAYTPTSITASARSATGSAPPAPYPARFIVTTRTATAGWVNRYTSSDDESGITWAPIPPDTALIRIRMYRGGGGPTVERLLDEVIIPVIDESVAVTPVGFGHVGRAPSTTVGADLTNVVATVLDEDDRIGVLYAWVNSDGYADPDPSGPADGYIEVQPSGGSATVTDAALWQLTGGGTGRLFRDLRISADQGKTITLEYVADDGETTGQQSFYLHSWAQIRDHALGEILPDAVKYSWQLAQELRPPVALPALPNGNPDDLHMVFVDGLLYKWEGGAWQPLVNAEDLDGEIVEDQIADAAVTAEKIRDASVGLTKFASGMRPVEIVSALPTSGNVVGRTVVLTTDGKLYRYTSSGWTTAVPTSDLTGEVGEDLLADAAVTADKIRSGAVGLAKFATGIRPVEIASSLPTSGNTVGRTVVLTGDGKLYRYTSSGWTAAVPTSDLTGEITSTQIADDAITTPKIAAGAVQAGHLDANSVTAGKIAAGAVGAGEIAAGAIQAEHIRVGSRILPLSNPSVTGSADGWPLGVVGVTNRFGSTVTALESETDGNLLRYSEWIDIDPTKTYEVRASLRSIQGHSGASGGGVLYFGLQAENASGTIIAVTPFDPAARAFGTATDNPYFWSGGLGSGAWRDMVAYIIGANADAAEVRAGKNVTSHYRLPPTARRIRLRWLNWSNGGVTRRAYLWSPTLTPVDATLIHGDGIVANSITTNKLAFTAVETGNVVAAINASSEGLRIQSDKITIDGSVQFGAGYDPTTKETPDGAQAKANAAQTAAINAAASDAESKASAAQAAAEATAATLAEQEAEAARLAAIDAASGDASTKAAAAQAAAEATAALLAEQESEAARLAAIAASLDKATYLSPSTTTIDGGKITTGSVEADQLAANSVITGKIAAGAVKADEIDARAVGTQHLRIGSPALMLNNPSVSGHAEGWPLGVVGATNRFGSTVTALESETDGNLQRFSEWIDIDPTKTYEVRGSLRSIQGHSGATDGGTLYLGIQAENASGSLLQVIPFDVITRQFVSETTNGYFWSGGLGSGAWRDVVGYILGENVDEADVRQGKNATRHFRLPATARRVRLQWLNWSNGGVARRAYLWSPTITPVDATLIHGDGIVTGSITTEKLAFTAVETGNVVAAINASSEGLRIQGERIQIDGSVQFANRYDPTAILTPGQTTIDGGKITTGTVDADRLNVNAAWIGALSAGAIGVGQRTLIGDGVIVTDMIASEQIIADHIKVTTLSEIIDPNGAPLGIVVSGLLRNAGDTIRLNLDATSAQDILRAPNVAIRANGTISLGDHFSVDASGNVTFAGELSGASGTFSGTVAVGATIEAGDFVGERLDLSAGGGIGLRPGGTWGYAAVDWLDASGGVTNSIDVSSTPSGDHMGLRSTGGDILFYTGGGSAKFGVTNDAMSTRETAVQIHVQGWGTRRVWADNNGILRVDP